MSDFHGYPVRRLSTKFLELDYLTTAGPRIVGLRYGRSRNLLAEVPEISIPTPYGDYRYLGGHRLWYAPESMPRTYIPDGEGLITSDIPNGLILHGKTEPDTGIHKLIEIRPDPDQPRVILTHTLINEGLWEVELAPWTITQFRLGGTAILPTQAATPTKEDLLPNRHFSLWPYSHLNDPRLHLEDEFIAIKAKHDMPPFKIGAFNHEGWSAYWLDGILFRKTFTVHTELPHPDNNCNAEIYCDDHFIELESLGPSSKLAPGDSVSFIETWELYDTLEQDFLTESMIKLCLKGIS